MLKKMKTSFPSTRDWNLSNMNDLDNYLPQLSQLPLTRELNSLIFEIHEVGKLITSFELSLSSVGNITSNPLPISSSSQPGPLVGPSSSSAVIHLCPRRSIRRLLTTTEASGNVEPILSICVKRVIPTKRVAEEAEIVGEVAFLVKVRRVYFVVLFLFDRPFLVQTLCHFEPRMPSTFDRQGNCLPTLYHY